MIIMGIVLFVVVLCIIGLVVVVDVCIHEIRDLSKKVDVWSHWRNRDEQDIARLGIKTSDLYSRVDVCEKDYLKAMENIGRELIRVNNYLAKIRVEERKARNMSVFEGAKENKELINDIYGEVAYKIHEEMKENEENEAEN